MILSLFKFPLYLEGERKRSDNNIIIQKVTHSNSSIFLGSYCINILPWSLYLYSNIGLFSITPPFSYHSFNFVIVKLSPLTSLLHILYRFCTLIHSFYSLSPLRERKIAVVVRGIT